MSADNGVKRPRPDSAVADVDGQINGQINKDLKEEEIDPWSLPELTDTGIPWSGEILLISYCLVSIIFNRF